MNNVSGSPIIQSVSRYANNRHSSYNWIKHSIGNKQSLINDQVNSIIEDSERDLWYATNNGISYYNSETGVWHSFMSSFEKNGGNKNHIFVTLCEVEPGIIWAAGYSSGIYQIKQTELICRVYHSIFTVWSQHPAG